ncbi:MAG: hypothetical protein RTV31_16545, partial [Candidatus Thorarchaeota archaeon]
HDLGQETLDKATTEWSLITEQEAIRTALKTSLQMAYTTEMVIARKAYEGVGFDRSTPVVYYWQDLRKNNSGSNPD